MNELAARYLLLLLALLAPALWCAPPQEAQLALDYGTELSLLTFPAQTADTFATLIWAPSEHGLQQAEIDIAEALARQLAPAGFEIVVPDYFSSYFLPPGASALDQVAASSLTALLQALRRRHADDGDYRIYLVAADKAAVSAMQALRQLQQEAPLRNTALILLNPDVTTGPPTPGKPGRYHPIVTSTNAPVFIVQAEKSPWRLTLLKLQQALGAGGSDVFVRLLRGVRDRFYFRPDATAAESEMARRLPALVIRAMQLLEPHVGNPRQAAAIATDPGAKKQSAHARERRLRPYDGPQGHTLALPDLDGNMRSLESWRGKVVLLNFWASWCPPCVHEIPSMVMLKKRLADRPFEIVAVNLGETKAEVLAFLRQHPVNFPVLLDPRNEAARAWRVSAYPTTFIIDRAGNIRYALAGGRDWADDATIELLRRLLDENA